MLSYSLLELKITALAIVGLIAPLCTPGALTIHASYQDMLMLHL